MKLEVRAFKVTGKWQEIRVTPKVSDWKVKQRICFSTRRTFFDSRYHNSSVNICWTKGSYFLIVCILLSIIWKGSSFVPIHEKRPEYIIDISKVKQNNHASRARVFNFGYTPESPNHHKHLSPPGFHITPTKLASLEGSCVSSFKCSSGDSNK